MKLTATPEKLAKIIETIALTKIGHKLDMEGRTAEALEIANQVIANYESWPESEYHPAAINGLAMMRNIKAGLERKLASQDKPLN